MSVMQKLQTIALNLPDIYDAGHAKGYAAGELDGYDRGELDGLAKGYEGGYKEGEVAGIHKGYSDGYDAGVIQGKETGMKDAYDAFWDAFQRKGRLDHYGSAFGGAGWTETTFCPKYDLNKISNASNMFNGFNSASSQDYNLRQGLERMGIAWDMSGAKANHMNMFTNAKISEVPVLDFTGCTTISTLFQSSGVHTVEKMIVKADNKYSNTFQGASKLGNVVFEGVIGNSINLQWCPLSYASIVSVMAALSIETGGMTATFKASAVNAAFETAEGKNDGSESEVWLNLIATKSNWTVSLV